MDKPLQPEELKAIEARCEAAAPGPWKREGDVVYTGHECGDTCERTLHDHFVFADPDVKPADAEFIAHARSDIPRLIATIEEARREQPVSDEAMDAASVEYANKVQRNLSRPDAFVWMIAQNAYLAGAKNREQPVRVADEALEPIEGVKERLREVARFLYALDTENSLAARKEVLYGIQTIADQEIILKAHGKEIAYLFEKLALTGDELAALAAAPKEGEE